MCAPRLTKVSVLTFFTNADAPKAYDTVNEQIKAGNEKNAQVLDISHSNALSKFLA